ncbi:MAG: MATE family efflux transporter [Butyricicoccus sp.]
MDNDTLLGKAPIPRAVAAMAIPSVISSLVTVVYNMADTFFVGQTGDALQVAAVSLTNPIFILLMAFANMFGMGGSAIISVALGETTASVKISSFISRTIGAALRRTVPPCHPACWRGRKHGLRLPAATHRVRAPFVIWSAAASFVVRAEGASKEAMIGSMIGTIANIVLDPVFVSGLGQGAAGAAIATTIGNMLAALYYLWYFLKKSRRFSLAPKDALCGTHIAVRVCSAGFPTAIFSALMCVSTIVLNLILVAYGNAPVAAIGIVFKANMFITFLQMGLANGVQPIFGYSYGAGDIKRFADTERFTKLCCFVVGLAATALYFFLRKPIIGLFVDDSGVITYGVQMLIAYMLSGPFIGFLFVNMNCMQSVGRALPATALSVLRQGLLLIPLLYLLNAVFGLNGAVLGQSITDYVTIALSCVVWRRIRHGLEQHP